MTPATRSGSFMNALKLFLNPVGSEHRVDKQHFHVTDIGFI